MLFPIFCYIPSCSTLICSTSHTGGQYVAGIWAFFYYVTTHYNVIVINSLKTQERFSRELWKMPTFTITQILCYLTGPEVMLTRSWFKNKNTADKEARELFLYLLEIQHAFKSLDYWLTMRDLLEEKSKSIIFKKLKPDKLYFELVPTAALRMNCGSQ